MFAAGVLSCIFYTVGVEDEKDNIETVVFNRIG